MIERKTDKKKLCGWGPSNIGLSETPDPSNEAVICTLSLFPETKTMIFQSDPANPNADLDLPILLKDDPKIIFDPTSKEKRGYSSM